MKTAFADGDESLNPRKDQAWYDRIFWNIAHAYETDPQNSPTRQRSELLASYIGDLAVPDFDIRSILEDDDEAA